MPAQQGNNSTGTTTGRTNMSAGGAAASAALPGTSSNASTNNANAMTPAARNKPCKECRVAKVRCLWTADSADTDARCSRCREKNRPCTKWINSSGVVPVDGAEDSLEGLLKQRRARWACIECKKRKRACEGGVPVFRKRPDGTTSTPPGTASAGAKRPHPDDPGTPFSTGGGGGGGGDAESDAALEMDGMSACDFCVRHGLECQYPAASTSLKAAIEMEGIGGTGKATVATAPSPNASGMIAGTRPTTVVAAAAAGQAKRLRTDGPTQPLAQGQGQPGVPQQQMPSGAIAPGFPQQQLQPQAPQQPDQSLLPAGLSVWPNMVGQPAAYPQQMFQQAGYPQPAMFPTYSPMPTYPSPYGAAQLFVPQPTAQFMGAWGGGYQMTMPGTEYGYIQQPSPAGGGWMAYGQPQVPQMAYHSPYPTGYQYAASPAATPLPAGYGYQQQPQYGTPSSQQGYQNAPTPYAPQLSGSIGSFPGGDGQQQQQRQMMGQGQFQQQQQQQANAGVNLLAAAASDAWSSNVVQGKEQQNQQRQQQQQASPSSQQQQQAETTAKQSPVVPMIPSPVVPPLNTVNPAELSGSSTSRTGSMITPTIPTASADLPIVLDDSTQLPVTRGDSTSISFLLNSAAQSHAAAQAQAAAAATADPNNNPTTFPNPNLALPVAIQDPFTMALATVGTEGLILPLHPHTQLMVPSPTLTMSIPQPMSPFDPSTPLPSSDCIFWMVKRFWARYDDMGRSAVIQRRRFLDTCLSSSGMGSPLLWVVLWGACVFWEKDSKDPEGRVVPWHPELTPRAKQAIVDRARMVLVGGLYQVLADLAVMESGNAVVPEEGGGEAWNWATNGGGAASSALLAGPTSPESLKLFRRQAETAKRIVPILQSLVLGINFSEKAGGDKLMVSLVSLSVKVAKCAATALKSWIRTMVARLTKETNAELGTPPELLEMEAWLQRQGISTPFPFSESLCASLMHPATLNSLSHEEKGEIVLLAEFCATYYYCMGCDCWAADVIGSKLQLNPIEVEEVPVPFDGRGFEVSDSGRVVYSGAPLSESHPTTADLSESLEPLGILPVVPGGLYMSWMSPHTTPEQRTKILTATMGDIFRVGPHFALYNGISLERKSLELRFLATSLGYRNVYPEGFNGSEQIRKEVLRLRSLMKEVVDALPKEIRAMESEGRIGDLMNLLGRCPTFNEGTMFNIAYLYLWNYEFQASMRSPPPNTEPEFSWYESPDGSEAGTYCILAARFIGKMLENGFDVNNRRLVRWITTKIDRITYILFQHLQHARRNQTNLAPMYENSVAICLRWFFGLDGQVRYREWVRRLGTHPDVEIDGGNYSGDDSEGSENLPKTSRIVSMLDKKLAKVGRGPMQNVDDAVLSLLAEEEAMGGMNE